MATVSIVIPQYADEVEFSKAQRKRYFKEDSYIPAKYRNGNGNIAKKYIFKRKGDNVYLYDTEEGEFVLANPIAAGTPNIRSIHGNDIYSKAHERVRMKIIGTIKDSFRPYLPKKIGLRFPIMVDIDLYCAPRYANWDLDNMWIYNKVFQDLLKTEGLIPDDTIRYITKAGAARYIPIINHDERKMVFKLTEDTDPRITGHILYNLEPKPAVRGLWDKGFRVAFTSVGKPGDLIMDVPNLRFNINIGGEKVIRGALKKALGRIYSQCIQMNTNICFHIDVYNEHARFIKSELCDKGIQVIVYD